MRIKIEDYRGWEISFDTDREVFHSISSAYDTEKENSSYASAKKMVDNYIKANTDFKPFWVETLGSVFNSRKEYQIIGIRKDNRFVYLDEDGNKGKISVYDEENYFLLDKRNDTIKADITRVEGEIELLNKYIEAVKKGLILKSLKEIKNEL